MHSSVKMLLNVYEEFKLLAFYAYQQTIAANTVCVQEAFCFVVAEKKHLFCETKIVFVKMCIVYKYVLEIQRLFRILNQYLQINLIFVNTCVMYTALF